MGAAPGSSGTAPARQGPAPAGRHVPGCRGCTTGARATLYGLVRPLGQARRRPPCHCRRPSAAQPGNGPLASGGALPPLINRLGRWRWHRRSLHRASWQNAAADVGWRPCILCVVATQAELRCAGSSMHLLPCALRRRCQVGPQLCPHRGVVCQLPFVDTIGHGLVCQSANHF